ncbi:N1R/p28-like protein [Histomonas meleagridis]|uniref:N1R/p28-like protein n=1 Tax=Histomonas meleagridis TaxID=135588 RepID=UPI00355A6A63|nr:N1R/p28-like protein [Histomonas meleagridis]
MWKSVKNAFEQRYGEGGRILSSYYLSQTAPKFQGEYIHPKLVHFVAEYCSVEYAFTVAEIMDSINDKVHEVLNEKQLTDTVENAKPVFIEVAKSIAPTIDRELENKTCWGYRDSGKTLDQWEQEDLARDIRE